MIRNLFAVFLLVASTASAQLAPGVPPVVGGGGLSNEVTYYAAVGCEKSVGETINGWWTHNSATASDTLCDNTGLSKGMNGRLTFAATSADEIAQIPIMLPADQTGAIDVRFVWSVAETAVDVIWAIETTCMGNDDEYQTPSYNSKQSVTDSAGGTANDVMIAVIAGITQTGCLPGEVMSMRVTRNSATVGDTVVGNAFLHGIEVKINRDVG